MKNISIKSKLYTCLGIIIILACFNSVTVLWYVNALSVNAQQSIVMRQYADSVYGMSLFDTGLVAALHSYIRSGNSADLARYRMIESEYQTVLQAALWLPLSEESFANLKSAFAVRRGLFETESQAIGLVGKGKSSDALALLDGDDFAGAHADFDGQIETTVSFAEETMSDMEIQRGTLLFDVKAMSLIGVLLLVIVGGGIIWLVTMYMSRSLRELRDAADAIGRGETGRRVKVYSKDDIGRMAIAFNKMAVVLDHEKMDWELKKITSDIGE